MQRKYKNTLVYVDNAGNLVPESFTGEKKKIADSKKEYRRYVALKAEQAAGLISGLRCNHATFKLTVEGVLICSYRPDFVYVRDGRRVVEDVKGLKTAVYKLKRKLMKALHNIEILET